MAEAYLYLPKDLSTAVWAHLLEDEAGAESAGFLFAKHRREGEAHGFEALEWYPVPPEGFLSRNSYHFVLTDQVRAEVIKRAHDLGASVGEFHCHRGPWPARFSLSDQAGFQEFVPAYLVAAKRKAILSGGCHRKRLRWFGVGYGVGHSTTPHGHRR